MRLLSGTYVATRAYDGHDEFGSPLEIREGTIVSPDWWGLSVPGLRECFVPQDSPAGRRALANARRAVRSSSRVLAAGTTIVEPFKQRPPVEEEPLEQVELRMHATSTVTLVLGERLWGDLQELAREGADGREVGGGLFGDPPVGWATRIEIGWVVRAAKARQPARMELDILALAGEKSRVRASDPDSRKTEIGSWHTHPGDPRGIPSDADLATSLNAFDFLNRSRHHGLYPFLLLTSQDFRFSWNLEVHGWVLRRDNGYFRHNAPVCEPAIVELPGRRR